MKKIVVCILSLGLFIACKKDQKTPVEPTKTVEATKAKGTIKVLDPITYKEAIANKDLQLIDVRTPGEREEGFIENSKLIDYNAEGFKDKLLELDKTKPVYIYCQSGGRSALASEMMMELGFSEVYDLQGGYLAWE